MLAVWNYSPRQALKYVDIDLLFDFGILLLLIYDYNHIKDK